MEVAQEVPQEVLLVVATGTVLAEVQGGWIWCGMWRGSNWISYKQVRNQAGCGSDRRGLAREYSGVGPPSTPACVGRYKSTI